MLATGDVVIDGTVDLSGEEGTGEDAGTFDRPQPGPGGHAGGLGAPQGTTNWPQHGLGPGAGLADNSGTRIEAFRGDGGNGGSHASLGVKPTQNPNAPLPIYGDFRVLTLTGGSGGGGGMGNSDDNGASGGAGGGAILIASSGAITVNGTLTAAGGDGGDNAQTDGGGGGAGGSIRLIANEILGDGTITATGGLGATEVTGNSGNGGEGRVRLDAPVISNDLNVLGIASSGSVGIVTIGAAEQPAVRIVAIDGVPVPVDATGNVNFSDVTLPPSTTNPVDVEFETTNIPQSSIITLFIIGEVADGQSGFAQADSTPVNGDGEASVSIDLPTGAGAMYTSVAFP
jgi:hypothetical protein